MPEDEEQILFSESLLEGEDEEEQAEAEAAEARKYMDPEENLLAVIDGIVDGRTALDRLAVTDERVIFYPRGIGFLASFSRANAISLDYERIITVEGKKRLLLGEIDIATKENIFRFKQMDKDDVDQISRLVVKRKQKGKAREVLSPSRDTAFDQLKKLAELRQMGAITEEEYQEKRRRLMDVI